MDTADTRRAGHSNGGRPVSVKSQMLLSFNIYTMKKTAFYPHLLTASRVMIGYLLHNTKVQKN